MSNHMNIVEILQLRGLDTSMRIKMLRHMDSRYDLRKLYRSGQIGSYQAVQSRDILGKCDTVISFLGTEGTRAIFIGVWRVIRGLPAKKLKPPKGFLYPGMYDKAKYSYETEELRGFEEFTDRVVVDWGRGTRSWHQWISKKRVIEILPEGYTQAFPGYLNVLLEFDDLKRMIDNPEAHRTWHAVLSAVAGVYLITDDKTGQQYVGSAYGENGILGRWRSYANNGHGDNALLRDLVRGQSEYERNFRFSILRTLPITMTAKEVIEIEAVSKSQLGSRAHGLNLN